MALVDFEKYMVVKYIRFQHVCFIHILCLDFFTEFKDFVYIYTPLISMAMVDFEKYIMVEFIKY